jgi:hypothetical protein
MYHNTSKIAILTSYRDTILATGTGGPRAAFDSLVPKTPIAMGEFRESRLDPRVAQAAGSRADRSEEVDAAIRAAFRRLVEALRSCAGDFGWTARDLDSMHSGLRWKYRDLFKKDLKLTRAKNRIRWDPTDVITWGRLFGLEVAPVV